MSVFRLPVRRRLSLALAAALAVGMSGAAAAPAAEPARTYAVLSLAVDKLDIVSARMELGSHMDRNVHQVLPMPDDSLDIVALQAAEIAIKNTEPDASVELYATQDPKLYAIQDAPSDAPDDAPALLDKLKAIMAQSKATHLLLITKHRDDVRMKLHSSTTGHGRIAGVGFYVDEEKHLYEVDTGNKMLGYVASYASLRLRLIDLASRKTVRVEDVQTSRVTPTPESAFKAWEGMSPAEKVESLQWVINQALEQAVPKALGKR